MSVTSFTRPKEISLLYCLIAAVLDGATKLTVLPVVSSIFHVFSKVFPRYRVRHTVGH